MKIYLAHPITGRNYDEIYQYFEAVSSRLQPDWFVLHPMVSKGYLRYETDFKPKDYTYPVATNHAIVERDNWMVSQADVILLDFTDSTKVSIGCMFELAWAFQLRKHCVIVLPKLNIHDHAFVLECTDIIYQTLDEALEYLHKLAKAEW